MLKMHLFNDLFSHLHNLYAKDRLQMLNKVFIILKAGFEHFWLLVSVSV